MKDTGLLGGVEISYGPFPSSFGGVRASLLPLKLGGDGDTISLKPTRLLNQSKSQAKALRTSLELFFGNVRITARPHVALHSSTSHRSVDYPLGGSAPAGS